MSEIDRISRVSDQMITAHSILSSCYARRATILDLSILVSTIFANASILVAVDIWNKYISITQESILAFSSLTALILAVFQIKICWKEKSDAHNNAAKMYSLIKNDCKRLLSLDSYEKSIEESVLASYKFVCHSAISIPDEKFLILKKRHKIKIETSKILDSSPYTSLVLLKIKLWLRDNVKK